jgi:hypothetical protein
MSQTIHFLSTESVGELFSGIIGRRVTAAKAPPMNLKAKAARAYGVYRDRDKSITCLCILDLPLSVYAAGAMFNFPGCTINDSIRAGTIDESLLDTVLEILNICAQLFNDYGHQVFQKLYTSSESLPQDAAVVLNAPAGRFDLTVSIPGYGSGLMAVLIGV